MKKILLLTTTESNEDLAKHLAKLLIQKKLAGCISINEIYSTYTWEEKIEQKQEFKIVVKSIPEKLDDLIIAIKQETTFEVPQIIYKYLDTELDYYNWIKNQVH
tara:strand:- start:1658 stop:1969 length:312 start_codon:yes stop_codon:yes gene_type:complete